MRSLTYLGGDNILVLGQVYGIYSDMEPLDYLSIASVKYGDTNYDCNHIWPFNITAIAVVSPNRIAAAADYKRLVMWDGMSGNSVLWSVTTEMPAFLGYDSKCGLVLVEKGGSGLVGRAARDGKVTASAAAPFRILSQPVGTGGNGLFVTGDGIAAVLDGKLAVSSEYRASWISKDATAVFGGWYVFVSSSGKLARFTVD
ncbi:MAG TPA: hypothetical protein PKK63_01260 [Bacillota bacterium]|nr:MAG: hypothetical protein BWY00_01188 [Firmicutes bacterium ADurb.Bin153]HNV34145.1 hypothetical protein [Bacillota bacterium]HPU95566.1 hypothetical protein [Bacillota bacterium]